MFLYLMSTFHSHAGTDPPCILPSTWKLNCNYSLHPYFQTAPRIESQHSHCLLVVRPDFQYSRQKKHLSGICREDTKSDSTLCFGCNLLLLQTSVSTSDQKDLCNPNDEGGRWQLHRVTPLLTSDYSL